jgi:hypothetical protein
MQNILTGIYARYSGDAALKAAIPGGLHFEMAPQAVTSPYATYFMTSGYPDYWLGGRKFEVITIQFDIFAVSNTLRLTAYAALTALYDDSRPTATGYTSVLMERTNQQLLREGSQNELFRAIVTYDCRYSN